MKVRELRSDSLVQSGAVVKKSFLEEVSTVFIGVSQHKRSRERECHFKQRQ